VDNAYACAEGADALVVIVTEWEQFRALDLARLKQIMARPVVVDLRNVYRPDEMARHGFDYVPVGRKAISPAPGGIYQHLAVSMSLRVPVARL
jgi:UDPglucose 6-dehydrogenase